MARVVEINVPTALAFLRLSFGSDTGVDPDTRPGVGFTLETYPGVAPSPTTSGVIPRADAARLLRALADFLAENPPDDGRGLAAS